MFVVRMQARSAVPPASRNVVWTSMRTESRRRFGTSYRSMSARHAVTANPSWSGLDTSSQRPSSRRYSLSTWQETEALPAATSTSATLWTPRQTSGATSLGRLIERQERIASSSIWRMTSTSPPEAALRQAMDARVPCSTM